MGLACCQTWRIEVLNCIPMPRGDGDVQQCLRINGLVAVERSSGM